MHRSHAKIPSESTGINERSGRPESARVLREIPFGLLAQQEAHLGLGYCSRV
jgi:hypothetical protein